MSEKIKVSIASEVDRKKIYKIRHDVYAKELGQHKKNSEMLLTDVLDEFNIYFVAKFSNAVLWIHPYSVNMYYINFTFLMGIVDKCIPFF